MSSFSAGHIPVSVLMVITIMSFENTRVNNVVSNTWLLTIFSHYCDPPFLSESFPFRLWFQIFDVFWPAKMKTFPKCDPYLSVRNLFRNMDLTVFFILILDSKYSKMTPKFVKQKSH